MKLLCDVSGSMYRFNGHDGRLEREMETMVMVMEALEKYEHKVKVCNVCALLVICSSMNYFIFGVVPRCVVNFQYEIIGHSGEGYDFPMFTSDKAPTNNKERLNIIKVSFESDIPFTL